MSKDIMASGDWGRDDGIKCNCGGKTYLVDDQGGGLCSYSCEECEETFSVQFDGDDEEDFEPPSDWSPWDDLNDAELAL